MRARRDPGVIRGRLFQRGWKMRAEEGGEADRCGHGVSGGASNGVRESAGLSAKHGGEWATRLGRAGEERRLLGRLQVCW